jgi:tRNA threonylcarbamoyladenosine biosynthesis protein TsaB
MILALKTADSTTSIKLVTPEGRQLGSDKWESGRKLSAELLSRIQMLLEQQSATFDDISGIVVFSGPGSFTSLRIGHSVANALADSLSVAVVGAGSEEWLDAGLKKLPASHPGRPALPVYGSEAHITRPKA